MDKGNGSIRVHKNLKPGVRNVKNLVSVLQSDSLYLNQLVYNCLAGGFEAGKIKGLRAQGTTPLERIITIGYEAHFRVELILALSSQGYRHAYTPDACNERTRMFEKMLPVVKRDRENNAEQAFKVRSRMVAELVQGKETDKETEGLEPAVPLNDDPTMNGEAEIPAEYF